VYILNGDEFFLTKSISDRNSTLCNFSEFNNLTLAVTLVNSAGKESELVTKSFVGSEFPS
jgi:hypothetical protein